MYAYVIWHDNVLCPHRDDHACNECDEWRGISTNYDRPDHRPSKGKRRES